MTVRTIASIITIAAASKIQSNFIQILNEQVYILSSIAKIKQPFIWAHRGASALAPENTMASFHAAAGSGADGIELDVHLSADDVPVVIHDETLDRTTDASGYVNQTNWKSLQRIDAGSWFADAFTGEAIPSLENVLNAFSGKLRLNLELKDHQSGLAVLELLKSYHDADIVISSFNHDLLLKLKAGNGQLPVAVLYETGPWRKAVALAVELKALSFNPRVDQVTRLMVAKCHNFGLPVYAWTVDDRCFIRKLQRAGVDGFFSNDPQKVRRAWFSQAV